MGLADRSIQQYKLPIIPVETLKGYATGNQTNLDLSTPGDEPEGLINPPSPKLPSRGCSGIAEGRGEESGCSVRGDDFLNVDSSKSSIEEADNFASDVAFPALLVSEDALVGGEDEVAELPGGEDVAGPLFELGDEDVVPGGYDSALVDAADEFDHDLLAPVIVDDFELSDVLVLLHDAEELDQNLGDGPQLDLLLPFPLCVDDTLEGIS
jgi:hypothetical protein